MLLDEADFRVRLTQPEYARCTIALVIGMVRRFKDALVTLHHLIVDVGVGVGAKTTRLCEGLVLKALRLHSGL